MFARPELLLALDVDVAIGHDLAGLLVHADLVGGQEGAAVANQHAVGAVSQAGLRIELHPALFVERFDFPPWLLLRPERAGKGQDAQGEREHGAQSCHLAP